MIIETLHFFFDIFFSYYPIIITINHLYHKICHLLFPKKHRVCKNHFYRIFLILLLSNILKMLIGIQREENNLFQACSRLEYRDDSVQNNFKGQKYDQEEYSKIKCVQFQLEKEQYCAGPDYKYPVSYHNALCLNTHRAIIRLRLKFDCLIYSNLSRAAFPSTHTLFYTYNYFTNPTSFNLFLFLMGCGSRIIYGHHTYYQVGGSLLGYLVFFGIYWRIKNNRIRRYKVR